MPIVAGKLEAGGVNQAKRSIAPTPDELKKRGIFRGIMPRQPSDSQNVWRRGLRPKIPSRLKGVVPFIAKPFFDPFLANGGVYRLDRSETQIVQEANDALGAACTGECLSNAMGSGSIEDDMDSWALRLYVSEFCCRTSKFSLIRA